MKYDIVALITDMLNAEGAGDLLDKDLTNHSTISLNMKGNIPTIFIKEEDDYVWVWSILGEYHPSTLPHSSAKLFSLMFEFDEEHFYLAQPCLYPVDGNLELRAQIKECHLESKETFSEVLEAFFLKLQSYCDALV